MATEIIQQIIEKLGKVQNILILLPPSGTGDHFGAGLAMQSFLKKMEKEAILVCPTSNPLETTAALQAKYNFLPGFNQIINKLSLTKSFVIDVSTAKSDVEELSYKKEQGRLSIFLKSSKDPFTTQDISFRNSDFPFELIITLGISSLEQLGAYYDQNTELFFETPIINIDYRSANENYGHYNLVELSATSVSEIILDLINKFESNLIDENIATQLLTGIIVETNSFQHIRTTPQTFLKASQLVSLGARQQEIINYIYKSKSMGLLKLWGRVLARLKQEPEIMLVSSAVNLSDVEKSETSNQDIAYIIKEMIAQLGFAKIFLFLKEENEKTTLVYCAATLPIKLAQMFSQYNPETIAVQTIKFLINMNITDAENQIIQKFKQEIPKLQE